MNADAKIPCSRSTVRQYRKGTGA